MKGTPCPHRCSSTYMTAMGSIWVVIEIKESESHPYDLCIPNFCYLFTFVHLVRHFTSQCLRFHSHIVGFIVCLSNPVERINVVPVHEEA